MFYAIFQNQNNCKSTLIMSFKTFLSTTDGYQLLNDTWSWDKLSKFLLPGWNFSLTFGDSIAYEIVFKSNIHVSHYLKCITIKFKFVQEYYSYFFTFHIEEIAIFNDLSTVIKVRCIHRYIHVWDIYFQISYMQWQLHEKSWSI